MTIRLKTWSTPVLKVIDLTQTMSRPSPAQAEAQNNSQQHHVPGGPVAPLS
jgi:hypothetical protein